MSEQANPYASPSEAAQRSHSAKFTLDDEQRKLISNTALIMIIAGVLQPVMTLIYLWPLDVSIPSAVVVAMFVVVPSFVAVAGFSLRAAASQGSVEALLAGFRQLFVVFLVKGIVFLIYVVGGLLTLLLFTLGVGIDLFD